VKEFYLIHVAKGLIISLFVYLVCACVNEDPDSSKTVELPPEMSFDKSSIFEVRPVLYFTILAVL